MGFLDPLFFTILIGFAGLIGANTEGVSVGWLYGESLYLAGCTFLVIRDWNAFSSKNNPAYLVEGSEFSNIGGKSFDLYRYWVVLTAALGITAMGLGFVGDSRLSSSEPRKILDLISSLIFAGKTYEYEAANSNIKRSHKPYLMAGLIIPFIVGASKSSGLFSLFWVLQRWLNPSSAFFCVKPLFQGKTRLIPVLVITSTILLALLTALRTSGASIATFIDLMSIRFGRDLDIYIFLDNLSQSTISRIVSESGGWTGALLGGISGSPHNIGSLAKAYSYDIMPDATGANPRLHALIIAMNGLGNESTILSLSAACIEIWCLSRLRKVNPGKNQSQASVTFNFVAWTTIINVFHNDISSLKYGIVSLLMGNILLKVTWKRNF